MRVIAVGTRVPVWVTQGFDDYARRLTQPIKLELLALEAGRRSANQPAARAIKDESERLLATLKPQDYVVAMDERGKEFSTRELADWLALRMQSGQHLALLVGGADGLAAQVLERASHRWSLSRLTLPHALVRVVLAEQLYRAHSLLNNHPYHRD